MNTKTSEQIEKISGGKRQQLLEGQAKWLTNEGEVRLTVTDLLEFVKAYQAFRCGTLDGTQLDEIADALLAKAEGK